MRQSATRNPIFGDSSWNVRYHHPTAQPGISYAAFDAAVHYMSYDITDAPVLTVVGRGYADFTQHGPGSLLCEHDRLDTLIEGFWY